MALEQDPQPVLSVSEFVEYINLAIGRKRVVVEGEISGFSINQGKWAFFDLKDVNSKISCFAMAYQLGMPLEDGMSVQVFGAPRLYGKSGKFSIMVDHVELKGVGALKRAFELTKAKLQQEGLFDLGRKRPLAVFPQAIGLICSSESAAYTDFTRIINQRWGGLEIHLAHVHVQGESAIKEIVGAFQWFNTHGDELGIETLVLIRGGGSLEDLQAFNSEAVARAVFGSRITVVCGVGHERDESLADYAADVRAATPTHAATLTVPDRQEIGESLRIAVNTLTQSIDHELEWHGSMVERSVLTLQHAIQGMLHHFAHVFRQFGFSLTTFESTLRARRESIQQATNLLTLQSERLLADRTTALASLERNLQNMNPLTVLKRGYSIVKRKGRVISSIRDIKIGDCIDVRVSDGDITAKVAVPQGELF